MTTNEVQNLYFEWLLAFITDDEHFDDISYRRLLMQLHDTEFTWDIENDANRAEYGIALRFRFAGEDRDIMQYLRMPCSVLEMMIALALQIEESIATDPDEDDRTAYWFWGMIDNLGLSDQFDSRYTKRFVTTVIKRFLERRYEPDGQGGLFYVENANRDLTKVEIWYQMLWYLDEVL